MSKIVKHNEFKKVVNALWDKSKEVYEHIWDMCTYLEKDKASLSKDNVFVGKNTFNEVMLTGKTVFNQTSTIPDSVIYGTGRYCGYRAISTHNNAPTPLTPKYVSAVKIRVLDGLNVGDIVDGVHVVEVEKGADKLNDIVGKTIADGSSFIVEEDAEYQRCIYVPVEKEYSNDTYFLIAQSGTGQFRQIRFDHLPNHVQESINGLVTEQLPAEGQPLNHDRGVGWVVLHGLTTNTIDVRKKLNSLGIADITGLQGQLDGKIDKTQIGTTDGKIPQIGAGDKLPTSIMPDLAITDVHVVQDSQAMMQLTVQVGDVVVVQNEGNKTYMCKDPSQPDKNNRFIVINMGFPVVKQLNGQVPDPTGALVINGTQINVDGQLPGTTIKEELDKCVRTVNSQTPIDGNVNVYATQINSFDGVTPGNVQSHLTSLRTDVRNHNTRISNLESKKPTIHIGEIITTFKDNGLSYQLNGVTYLYCGTAQPITNAAYPQLMQALGLTGVQRSELPVIQDQTIQYDLGQRRAIRKHYICAKIG